MTAHHGDARIVEESGKSPSNLLSLKGELTGAVVAVLVSLPMSLTIGIVAFSPLGEDYVVQGALAGAYGAVIVGLVALVFGARSIVITGPRVATALIFASLLASLMGSEDLMFPPGESIPNAIAIGFFAVALAGVLQFSAGASGIGRVVKNIPQPVVSGFINSSAVLLILGQIWVLLDVPKGEDVIETIANFTEMRPLTMIPGLATIAVIVFFDRRKTLIPSSLLGLLAGTGVFYGMRWISGGKDMGPTLGEVTSVLPTIQAPEMLTGLVAGGDVMAVAALVVPAALAMAALASLDTIFAMKSLDDLTEQRSESNRELLAHGAGNFVASVFGGMMSAGGMVRTKPAYDAGGRSRLMVILASLIMLAAVLSLAPLIEYIPRAAISGILLVIGFQIFDRWSLSLVKSLFSKHALQRAATATDIAIISLVITVAVVFNLVAAVLSGIVVAVILFVSRMSRSLVRKISQGPQFHSRSAWDEHSRSILEDEGHKVVLIELEGAIFFGSAEGLENVIEGLIEDGVMYFVLDIKRVKEIDSTGAYALERIHHKIRKNGGRMAISSLLKERRRQEIKFRGKDQRQDGPPRHLWLFLEGTGFTTLLGEDRFYSDSDSAMIEFERLIVEQGKGSTARRDKRSDMSPIIFRNLTRHEIRELRLMATHHIFNKDEVIFEQGDDGDSLYFINKGRTNVVVHIPTTGEKKRVQTLFDGAVFGEMAILDQQPRAASVIAVNQVRCYRLGVDAFQSLKSEHNEIAVKLLNNLCILFSERMRSANAMITELEK